MMAHQAAYVPEVEYPAECLGQGVGRVDSAGDVFEDNIAAAHPFLDSIPLDVDVARALSWLASICHQDGCLVITVNGSGGVLWKTEVGEDGAEVLGHFVSLDSGNELGLRGGRGNDRLEFGAICDGTATECEGKTGDRAAGRGVRAVGSVNIADEFVRRGICGERRKGAVHGIERCIGNGWERSQRYGSPVQDAAMDGFAEVFGDPYEPSVMRCGGSSRVAGEGTHSVPDVEAAGDVGVKKLAENATIGETELLFEGGSGWCARRWPRVGVDSTGESLGKGFEVFGVAFVQVGLVPLMGLEEAADVRFARDLDVVGGLCDVDADEGGDETAVGDFDLGADLCDNPFCGGFVGTGDG
jgi:hypothetical protein